LQDKNRNVGIADQQKTGKQGRDGACIFGSKHIIVQEMILCLKYGGITAQMGSDKLNVGSDKTHVGQ